MQKYPYRYFCIIAFNSTCIIYRLYIYIYQCGKCHIVIYNRMTLIEDTCTTDKRERQRIVFSEFINHPHKLESYRHVYAENFPAVACITFDLDFIYHHFSCYYYRLTLKRVTLDCFYIRYNYYNTSFYNGENKMNI